MGVVISLAEIKRARFPANAQPSVPASDEVGVAIEAMRASVDRSGVLAAARPLLERCRDRYGFVVMRDRLPQDPAILGRAVQELFRGLSMLDAAMRTPRTYPTFGVYFGGRRLAWFEDGYSGTTGLAVPNDTKADDLAAFVRPRVLARPRSRSQE